MNNLDLSDMQAFQKKEAYTIHQLEKVNMLAKRSK